MAIDIVVATCERVALLQRTLAAIRQSTRSEYRLFVIDDASTGGNREYLQMLLARGQVDGLLLRERRAGIAANLRDMYTITSSPLIVYCDDDQLCPDVEPDWLSRLLCAMENRPRLALVALNNPHGNVDGDKRRRRGRDGEVTFCEKSGGSYMLIRRDLLPLIAPSDGLQSPVSAMCQKARQLGWENGYLTDTYCWHIGAVSARNGWDLSNDIERLRPVNERTLEPALEFRG